MKENLEPHESHESLALEDGGKLEFDSEQGLFRIVAKLGNGKLENSPWMAGQYLKGQLSHRVRSVEYASSVAFIDERDPQIR